MQSPLEQKQPLRVYAADHNLPPTLTANQWTLMEPFEKLMRVVSTETGTAAYVIPVLTVLKHVVYQENSTEQGIKAMNRGAC